MITVERLIKILENYPKDASVFAYEGIGIGLVVDSPNHHATGWIETGPEHKPCDESQHTLFNDFRGGVNDL